VVSLPRHQFATVYHLRFHVAVAFAALFALPVAFPGSSRSSSWRNAWLASVRKLAGGIQFLGRQSDRLCVFPDRGLYDHAFFLCGHARLGQGSQRPARRGRKIGIVAEGPSTLARM